MVGLYDVSRWTKLHRKQTQPPNTHTLNINVISDGITRLPVLEGEISQIELPRAGYNTLGLSIVGGADTPLRCVVIQEVFVEGLVSQDGRLLAGDQIVEVDGTAITSATHQQVCEAFRKCTSVIRLGVYREKIETYRTFSSLSSPCMSTEGTTFSFSENNRMDCKLSRQPTGIVTEILDMTLPPDSARRLAMRLGRHRCIAGVFIVEFVSNCNAEHELRLFDRILFMNGEDLRNNDLEHAIQLLHENTGKLHVVIERNANRNKMSSQDSLFGNEECWHTGSLSDQSECSGFEDETLASDSCSDLSRSSNDTKSSSESKVYPKDVVYKSGSADLSHGYSQPPSLFQRSSSIKEKASSSLDTLSQVFGRKKDDTIQLQHKKVSLRKKAGEGLGMRIGGGVGSNEGDTPIYVANINLHGPAGKSHRVKRGDVLLSVNSETLLGLTHSQAVTLLKSTASLDCIDLLFLEGPETCRGRDNFVPSWLYWQRLPRYLHLSKSVILHRQPGSSLGFSIVGGHDSQKGPEPIHVLFVVATSPAAIEGRLRSGDRLLAVDGHSLEFVSHSRAVALLKQAGKRVILEVVSWLGTEL